MKIDIKQLAQILSAFAQETSTDEPDKPIGVASGFLGEYVIVRTYSAGVHAGVLVEKNGSEVVLQNARRLWRFCVPRGKSISLSAVAVYGIDDNKSKIPNAVPMIWLSAIEIIPASAVARNSIEGAKICEQS